MRKRKSRADGEGSVFYAESRGCWMAQIRISGPPDSRGHTRYRTRRAKTLREAVRRLQELKEQHGARLRADSGTITTADWLRTWFKTFARPRIRANTARSYAYILRIAAEEVGHIRLCRLTDIDLQGVLYGRLREKHRTARLFRTILRAALRRAVRSRMLQESPADCLELPPKPAKRPFVAPSIADWRALIDYRKSTYPAWRWILVTEFVTGARMSELLGLQWDDFTFSRDKAGRLTGGTLHIRHALIVGADGISLQPTKTARSDRVLQLPADYCREMQAYRMAQGRRAIAGFVFLQAGRPIHPASFSSHFARVRKRLGIGTTFHMLRHDLASRMKQSARFDLKDIQAQLGHSSIRITMDTYTHMTADSCRAMSDWLTDDLQELLARVTD